MRYLNLRLWGPFYVISLLIILFTMWTVDAVRPRGIALWLGSLFILLVVIFNFYMIYMEIKANETKVDKNRELSGLDPITRKSLLPILKKK